MLFRSTADDQSEEYPDLAIVEHAIKLLHLQVALLPLLDAPSVAEHVEHQLEEQEGEHVVAVSFVVADDFDEQSLVSLVQDLVSLVCAQIVHDQIRVVLHQGDFLLLLAELLKVGAALKVI